MADTSSSQSAWLQGPDWVQHAYLKGHSPQRWIWAKAYLAGSTDTTPDSTAAYLYGGSGVSDSTPAMVTGFQITKTSRISAYMYSHSHSSINAYLSGPT